VILLPLIVRAYRAVRELRAASSVVVVTGGCADQAVRHTAMLRRFTTAAVLLIVSEVTSLLLSKALVIILGKNFYLPPLFTCYFALVAFSPLFVGLAKIIAFSFQPRAMPGGGHKQRASNLIGCGWQRAGTGLAAKVRPLRAQLSAPARGRALLRGPSARRSLPERSHFDRHSEAAPATSAAPAAPDSAVLWSTARRGGSWASEVSPPDGEEHVVVAKGSALGPPSPTEAQAALDSAVVRPAQHVAAPAGGGGPTRFPW